MSDASAAATGRLPRDDNEWITESMKGTLEHGEVDVWMVPFDGVHTVLPDGSSCLSPGEKRRATTIVDPVARRSFVLLRLALRSLLSLHLGVAPREIEVAIRPGGKPAVAGDDGPCFSLSHARRLGLIAIARDEVGIDVESHRALRHPRRTLRRIFHPGTAAFIESLDDGERAAAFLDAWTQREAHVKAVGGGLFRTPDVLPYSPGFADGVLHQVRERDAHGTWSVARFTPVSSMRAAVVVRGTAHTLRLRTAADTLEQMAEVLR
jgi:4'-phosphopantetheinyl transferase